MEKEHYIQLVREHCNCTNIISDFGETKIKLY